MNVGVLPDGWTEAKLPHISHINLGQSPSSSDVNGNGDGIPFFQGKAEFGKLYPTVKKYCTDPKKIADANDILLSVRAPVGPTNLTNRTICIGRGLAAIKAENELINFKYLFHFFRAIEPWMSEQGTGTTFKAISGQFLKDLSCVVAPLAEQKIIADKLDTLLAQVETTKTRLERIPVILKRFRQSVLAAAVSGKLTEDWRGQHCPRDYQWGFQKVSDIVSRIEAGKNIRCIETPPQENEYGIVKISAVTWGSYNEAESKTLPSSKNFIEKRRVKVGDFLISRANTIELLGSPVIVHKVRKNLMLSDKVLRLVMKNEDKPWLDIFLRSQNGRKEIEARATGNQQSMRNIGQKALLDIDLPKPSPDEQSEIVRRVEQFFAYADSIEQQVQAALARVNNLTQSILAKAFRGELTADWRAANPDLISGDNSAEALLEKIKAEREALAKQPKKRKPAVKKKTGKKMSKQITRVVDQ